MAKANLLFGHFAVCSLRFLFTSASYARIQITKMSSDNNWNNNENVCRRQFFCQSNWNKCLALMCVVSGLAWIMKIKWMTIFFCSSSRSLAFHFCCSGKFTFIFCAVEVNYVISSGNWSVFLDNDQTRRETEINNKTKAYWKWKPSAWNGLSEPRKWNR